MITPARRERIDAWIAADPDPEMRAELLALVASAGGDGPGAAVAANELAARFSGTLAFGTAGLRAEMGAGPMRMNRLVVRRAAAGLARFLGRGSTIVIGFDARHRSDAFAEESARVFAGAGCRALCFTTVVPTPVLAFAIRHLGADAGVMCTASHNPRRDNGYKVYLGDGAQIIAPIDAEIATAIEVAAAGPIPLAPTDDPAITALDADVVEAYLEYASTLPASPRSGPSIVYTPLHGVGRSVAAAVLSRSGFTDRHDVTAQAEPDPDFPTVTFPNPEEPGALDLAVAAARRLDADVVLANDPDADRLGVALPVAPGAPDPDGSGWRCLTGNEIGAVLGEHILTTTSGADRLVVTTFVSSRLLERQAEHHGVQYAEVLTGFKWIVRPALARPDLRFVFGFEEALGFSVDPYVRDKDGITAARAFAEAMAALAADGRTVDDRLEELARRHGHHATRTWSVRFDGPDSHARMAAVLDRWRTRPPSAIGGVAVVTSVDLARGGRLPPTDALVAELAERARVVLRPSGTEPKVKVYLEVVVPVGPGSAGFGDARREGDVQIERLRAGIAAELGLDDG